MCRMFRTNILDSSADWSHSCWKSVVWTSRIQGLKKRKKNTGLLQERMRAIFSFGLGGFLKKESTNLLKRSCWLLVFWDPSEGRGPEVSPLWMSACIGPLFSIWHLPLIFLLCWVCPNPAPVRIAPSKDENSNILLKIGRHSDGSEKGSRGLTAQIRTFNQPSWSWPHLTLCLPSFMDHL